MKSETEDSVAEDAVQSVICPRCRKVHYSRSAIIDSYIDCSCGLSFYAFSCKGLRITMPANEAGYDSTARAIRRFVVATGRCTDIPSELYQDEDGQLCFGFYDQAIGTGEQLEIVLDRYQNEVFGESFLTKEMISSICELLKGGSDVEIRKQKDGVDIIKLIKKRLSAPEKRYRSNNGIVTKYQH